MRSYGRVVRSLGGPFRCESFGVELFTLSVTVLSGRTEWVQIMTSRSYPVPSLVASGKVFLLLTVLTRRYLTRCVIGNENGFGSLPVTFELLFVLYPT